MAARRSNGKNAEIPLVVALVEDREERQLIMPAGYRPDARNFTLAHSVLDGQTFADAANEAGVTTERARQIFNDLIRASIRLPPPRGVSLYRRERYQRDRSAAWAPPEMPLHDFDGVHGLRRFKSYWSARLVRLSRSWAQKAARKKKWRAPAASSP